MLFGKKKKDQVVLELNTEERRLLRRVMIAFRNKILSEGGPTEDIDRLILRLTR